MKAMDFDALPSDSVGFPVYQRELDPTEVWPKPDKGFTWNTMATKLFFTLTLAEQFEEITGYPPHGCKSCLPPQKMIQAAIERMRRQMEDDLMNSVFGWFYDKP